MHDACLALRRDCGPAYLATLVHQTFRATGMQIDIFADITSENPETISIELKSFLATFIATLDRLERDERELLQSQGNVIDFQSYKRRRLLRGQSDGTDGAA